MPGTPLTARGSLLVGVLPLLTACVTLTADPRAVIYTPGGIQVQSLDCAAAARVALTLTVAPIGNLAVAANALDPGAIHLLTWNIHKEDDAGWEQDLARFAMSSDVLLLQEATLQDSLRDVLRNAGLRWMLASSFIYRSMDIGVLTASRAVPLASCTQRFVEPLIRLPKSAIIDWFRIAGTTQTLAVANVHAINFSLSLQAYEAQLGALADALAGHEGPIVLGGDLNTWTDARLDVVRRLATRLGLTEITYAEDRRTLFFGKQLDHLLIRGLHVVASRPIPVTSSDHNPVEVVLRYARGPN
jgi:endonuclease/exonuclease/phosphatase (EEP) superfamily protein YafD